MKTKLVTFFTLLLISSAVFGQLTHQDIWLTARVGTPIISPDGKWVVFSVNQPAYDEKDASTDLWIAPTDAKEKPRKLTSTKGGEGGVAWSPDGKILAFSAKREGDETAQIYLLDLARGGEAQRLTNVSIGAGSPNWSPDGKMIAFTSRVFPGAVTDSVNKKITDEKKKVKYKARVYETFPIRNWDAWLDEKQTHIFTVKSDDGTHIQNIIGNSNLVREKGFAMGGGFNWSPDGKSILFSASINSKNAAYEDVIYQLYQVDLSGSEPKRLTSGKDNYGSPKFSPDGKKLFTSFSFSTDTDKKVFHHSNIIRFDWPSMKNESNLTSTFDSPIKSWVVSLDGLSIYLLAEDASQDKFYSLNLSSLKTMQISKNESGSYGALSLGGNVKQPILISTYESATLPPEIVRLSVDGKPHQFLSSFNTEKMAKLNLPPVRHLWTKTSNGKNIHSLIVVPPGFDENKKYPLLVLMHGGPHSSWKDGFVYRWNYHLLAQPGYVVILTNYSGSTGYGESFAQSIQGDPFEGPGKEINEAAEDAVQKFKFIDGTKRAAGGASYGGHLANWMLATTSHYKCLINHAGLMSMEAQWATSDAIYHREINAGGPVWKQEGVWVTQNPARFAENFKTPMLVTIGEKDFRVPLNNAIETWTYLQRLQIPSKMIVFPDENHWILNGENSKFFFKELHDWLAKYLL